MTHLTVHSSLGLNRSRQPNTKGSIGHLPSAAQGHRPTGVFSTLGTCWKRRICRTSYGPVPCLSDLIPSSGAKQARFQSSLGICKRSTSSKHHHLMPSGAMRKVGSSIMAAVRSGPNPAAGAAADVHHAYMRVPHGVSSTTNASSSTPYLNHPPTDAPLAPASCLNAQPAAGVIASLGGGDNLNISAARSGPGPLMTSPCHAQDQRLHDAFHALRHDAQSRVQPVAMPYSSHVSSSGAYSSGAFSGGARAQLAGATWLPRRCEGMSICTSQPYVKGLHALPVEYNPPLMCACVGVNRAGML